MGFWDGELGEVEGATSRPLVRMRSTHEIAVFAQGAVRALCEDYHLCEVRNISSRALHTCRANYVGERLSQRLVAWDLEAAVLSAAAVVRRGGGAYGSGTRIASDRAQSLEEA